MTLDDGPSLKLGNKEVGIYQYVVDLHHQIHLKRGILWETPYLVQVLNVERICLHSHPNLANHFQQFLKTLLENNQKIKTYLDEDIMWGWDLQISFINTFNMKGFRSPFDWKRGLLMLSLHGQRVIQNLLIIKRILKPTITPYFFCKMPSQSSHLGCP